MEWNARSESVCLLRQICRNHPGNIQKFTELYNKYKNPHLFGNELSRRSQELYYKRNLNYYKQQLYSAKLELILRNARFN